MISRIKNSGEKSRRDDILLTVDFNLRKTSNVRAMQSPAGTTLCKCQVSSLRDLGACVVPKLHL